MNCANIYCVYNKGYGCTLDGININSKGFCDDCIMTNLDEKLIESEKEQQLQAAQKRQNDNN